MWSAEKEKWCCAEKQLGCLKPTSPPTPACDESNGPMTQACAIPMCTGLDTQCKLSNTYRASADGTSCCPVPCYAVHKISGLPCLGSGGVCKSGGVESGPGVNRAKECPASTACAPIDGQAAIGGEGDWTCQEEKCETKKSCVDCLGAGCSMFGNTCADVCPLDVLCYQCSRAWCGFGDDLAGKPSVNESCARRDVDIADGDTCSAAGADCATCTRTMKSAGPGWQKHGRARVKNVF